MKIHWYISDGESCVVATTDGIPPVVGSNVYFRNMLIDYQDLDLDVHSDPLTLGRLGHKSYIVKRVDHVVIIHSVKISDIPSNWSGMAIPGASDDRMSMRQAEIDRYFIDKGWEEGRWDVKNGIIMGTEHQCEVVIE